MCESDDKKINNEDGLLINVEFEDEAETQKKQDDEDLFDLFILNKFFGL